ncbi:hypothetical protein BPAE_0217g00110 [Botrytis paeoniae]|uniref:Uncharacterized protein n=1 Tax=Botrytis paeoniae TaxID=278948 RepID=A0A4Z1FDU3_9HELO|nr:hypothetical protein BPAE_0217g00110 [Botrytis paeoniae]
MDKFSKAKAAGQLMLQRISHDDNTQVDYPAQSIFDRPESRKENGWDIDINRNEISYTFHILEHIRKISSSNFKENWIGILASQFGKTDRFGWSLLLPNEYKVIKEILKEEEIMCSPDGLTVDINDSKGYGAALLGTPNGKGIGWLLAQHKYQLGNLKIVSVEIFGSFQVGFHDCDEDTGELIAGIEDIRGVEDPRDYLNLDFTIQRE